MLRLRKWNRQIDRQIKTALSTSEEWGLRGAYWKNPAAHNSYRIASAEPLLLEFTMRPYYYQGVAYGTCNIKVTSSGEFVMPNVVRTVAMCRLILFCETKRNETKRNETKSGQMK